MQEQTAKCKSFPKLYMYVILNSKNGPNTEENKSSKNSNLKQNLDHTLISANIINK